MRRIVCKISTIAYFNIELFFRAKANSPYGDANLIFASSFHGKLHRNGSFYEMSDNMKKFAKIFLLILLFSPLVWTENVYAVEKTERWRDDIVGEEDILGDVIIEDANTRWHGGNHDWLIEQTAKYVGLDEKKGDANKIRIMKMASKIADSECKCGEQENMDDIIAHQNGALHGFGNYFANAEVFAVYAKCIQQGKDAAYAQKTALDYTDAIPYISDKSQKELETSLESITSMLGRYSDSLPSATARKYFVYGFALHSIQDTYSHRTLVPEYILPKVVNGKAVYSDYIESNNSTDYKSRLGTDDFREDCWENLLEAFENDKLTFSVLVDYMKVPDAERYTDNGRFCKERYRKALDSSRNWLETIFDNEIPNGIDTIEEGRYVDLVSYDAYVKQMK